MQRRRSFKSIVCVILTLFMILGTGLEPLAGSGIQIALGAEKDFALSASELYQGTNVVPAEQASNETFMKRYVKSSGNVLSLNSRFAKVSEYTKDVKGAGDTLSLSKMYQSSSSKYWSAQYKWTPNATEIQYLNRSDIDFIYEGTLIPNKHDHWIGDDHWTDAYVTLRKGGWDLSSDYGWEDTGIIMGKSTQRNNRVTLDVKETMDVSIDSNNADKNYLTYTAKHLGGQTCGGPAVSGSVFYFVDTSYPRVTDIYLTTDAAGTTAMDTYTSFGGQSNKTAYVVLEFDQEIRLADNYAKKDAFTLALDAYYGADCGYTENSNYNLTATLIKMEGKKMTFQFEVPAKLPNGKNTNIYITGIKRNQEFNQEWELILYGKKSDDADVFQITGQKAQSRITDITGNSLNWNASVKTMGTYYFDNVAPTLKSINMTGAMITTESTKEPTSWEDNSTDRDATFAGVGDRLGFQVFFSEAVSYNSVSGMKAVLSIKDGSAPVELSVSHVSGSCVTFENVTITEGMTTAGQRIMITGFKTDKVVKDLAGNTIAMDLTSISLPPNQQIYLDVDAPLISTSKTATENVYVMDNETVGGECFSFPLVFKEDTSKASSPYYSMINDCPVYFSIHTPNDSIGFTWYVDNNPTSSLSGFVNSGRTTSTAGESKYLAKEKISDGVTYYLHIRLEPGNDYSDIAANMEKDGIYFNGTIMLYAQDWAGNVATQSYAVKHQVDTEAPTISIREGVTLDVDFTNVKATIRTKYKATDNYDLENVAYQWHYRFQNSDKTWGDWNVSDLVSVDLSSSVLRSKSETVTYTYSFDANDAWTNRVGEFYLTATASDRGSRVSTVTSRTLSFDFTKPTGKYSITTGSVEDPQVIPSATIGAATSTSTEDSGKIPRTLMVIQFSDGSAYMYDPQRYESTIKGREWPAVTFTSIEDIFAPLYEGYVNNQVISIYYGSWYTINYDWTTGECKGAEPIDPSDMAKILMEAYGALTVKFITSTEFGTIVYDGPNGAVTNSEVFTFTPSKATITESTVYLANYAQYQIDMQPVKDGNGQAIGEVLKQSESKTYPTLQDVAVTFQVTNTSDKETTPAYGLGALDYDNSKIELFYTGTKSGTETLVETWPLAETSDGVQTIIFDKSILSDMTDWNNEFKTGWYTLRITVKNLNGMKSKTKQTPYLFTAEENFFIDTTELDMSMDTYYKEYSYGTSSVLVRDGKAGSLYSFDDSTAENQEIILSLAETAASWRETTYLRFSRSKRTDGMGATLTENIRIRVRNATYDALNTAASADSEALWVGASDTWKVSDLSCGTNEYLPVDRMYYYYVPKLVSEYAAGAYGSATDATSYSRTALMLPMLDGYNLLVYEVENTNGIVTTYEVPVFVYGEAEEWDLDYSYETRGELIRSITATPVVWNDPALDKSTFYHLPSLEDDLVANSYTLYNDVNTWFSLLDQNGNMSTKGLRLEDENGELIDVDGVAPDWVYIEGDYYSYSEHNYCFTMTAYDRDSLMSAKDITITFDTDYSAVLLGKTGEDRINNTEEVTISIPLAVDENGEYLKNPDGTYAVWESYEVGNFGIYRTQILEENTATADDSYTGNVSIKVWGTWKWDEEATNGAIDTTQLPGYWRLKFNASDIYGNTASSDYSRKDSYGSFDNEHYHLTSGTINKDGELEWGILDESGLLGIAANVPMAQIVGYGAGKVQEAFSAGQRQRAFYTPTPMLLSDGTYSFHVTDLFGEEYDLELTVIEFGELGVDVTFSTTDPTNQPVTIGVMATGNVEEITSIVSSTGVTGTIDELDPANASITVEENCTITITTSSKKEDGSYVQRVVKVTNIDKKVDDTYVEFYDYTYDKLTGQETEVEGEVTVYLLCDTETIYTTNGPDSYTFPTGSRKGDTYTFEYMDAAGNVGTRTVVLPFDIVPVPPAPDKEKPDVLVTMYGIRNNKSQYLTDLFNPEDVMESDNTVITAGEQISSAIQGYKAQAFRFMLSITDASATKVIVQAAGAAAPTDYNAVTTGSAVDFVTVSAADQRATLNISKNGTFDIYVIDANNNVTAITGVTMEGVDTTAPELTAEYEVGRDGEGLTMVNATFVPVLDAEKFDLILPITTNIFSKVVALETGEKETDYDENDQPIEVPVTQNVTRYYTVFHQNGEFTFHYRDEYGNLGQAVATLKGLDTAAAIVNSVIWYGTVGNVLPEKSPVVNRDVTVELNMSKPVSEVELYVYSENMENHAGEQLPAEAPVSVTFTGTNIYVTYEANVDYQIVVGFTASASGRKGYYTLPTVQCIDKEAPQVTLVSNVLAGNKRSAKLTFSTDEIAMLSQNANKGYIDPAAETDNVHIWTATDNQTKELYFTDKAGNRAVYQLPDLGIDDIRMEILYSLSADGSDATDEPLGDGTEQHSGLQLDPGDTFYYKINKEAEVLLNGVAQADAQANVWTKMTLTEESGLHVMLFTDKNTGDMAFGLLAVAPADNIAPIMTLASNTVVVEEGVSMDAMMDAIRAGVTITDDKDGVITEFTVTGQPGTVTAGLYSLEYVAVDQAGNRTVALRNLFIMAEGTPILWINGEPGLPYGKVTLEDGENITLRMENLMEDEPVIIKYRAGIKTSGQMKYYATVVENLSFSVSEPGHYTIYVRSQDRVEYVTYIYVEEK